MAARVTCEKHTDADDRLIQSMLSNETVMGVWRLSNYRQNVRYFPTHVETQVLRKHVLACNECQETLGRISIDYLCRTQGTKSVTKTLGGFSLAVTSS